MRVLGLHLLVFALLLAACAPDYKPPSQQVSVPPARGTVATTQTVELSAFLVSRAAFAELADSTCTVSVGGPSVRVSPPVLLSVPVMSGELSPIVTRCKAKIGPAERQKALSFAAKPEAASKDGPYPSKISVGFSQ